MNTLEQSRAKIKDLLATMGKLSSLASTPEEEPIDAEMLQYLNFCLTNRYALQAFLIHMAK